MGLAKFHPGQPPQKLTPQRRAKYSRRRRRSLRKMAAGMGVGKDLIRQVGREADLKPHRLDRYPATIRSSNRKQLRSSDCT
jgi:hypothetical protein